MQSRLRWLFFFITILSVASMAARVPLDTDMWWHIKAGEVTIANHQPLLVDQFSYTRAGTPWINHSWLAEVVLAFLYQKLSFAGLTLYVVGLSVLTFGLLYFILDGHPFIKSLLIIIGSTFVSTVWSPRPQLFTLLFLSILVFIISRYQEGKIKKLWSLPVLFFVWGNFHGGYFSGILYLFFVLVGLGYTILLTEDDSPDIRKQFWQLLKWIGISIPALIINPNGLNILRIPFSTVGVNALRDFINEWASPDFHQILQMGFLLLFFGLIFVLVMTKKRVSASELFTVFGFSVLAFYAKRNVAPFVIVMLPILAKYFVIWLEERNLPIGISSLLIKPIYQWRMRDDNPLPMQIINGLLVFMLGMIAAGKIIYVSYPMVVNGYLEQSMPVKAYQRYAALSTDGHLLNEYGWGGYQIAIYPQIPVFVDGRTDLFGDQVIGEWMSLMHADGDYEKVLDKYDINAVLLQKNRALIRVLKEAGWTAKYEDQAAVLLLRDEKSSQ